jgi:hypothetical protein
LKACLSKPEVLKARAEGVKQPDASWRNASTAKPTYSNAKGRNR